MRRTVTQEQARRIAVRAQMLDGSARGVLDTVRRLGFLQLDPIATVARPQHLVLWSRLGPFDTEKLDRLLWVERKLFEWNAFIWPMESLPLIKARMRAHRRPSSRAGRWQKFVQENAAFRRYILRELERRGPLLNRELEDRAEAVRRPAHSERWWGTRQVNRMLEALQFVATSPSSVAAAGTGSGAWRRTGSRRPRRCRSATLSASSPSSVFAHSASAARRASG